MVTPFFYLTTSTRNSLFHYPTASTSTFLLTFVNGKSKVSKIMYKEHNKNDILQFVVILLGPVSMRKIYLH